MGYVGENKQINHINQRNFAVSVILEPAPCKHDFNDDIEENAAQHTKAFYKSTQNTFHRQHRKQKKFASRFKHQDDYKDERDSMGNGNKNIPVESPYRIN